MQRLAIIATLASILCHGLASGYSDLIVLGDSLSDVGNTNTNSFGFAGADPYSMGRFSNGEVYVDHLAPLLGLDAPSRSGNGGSIYAHGGAQVALNSNVIVNSLRVQADDYLDSTSSTADPDALYIVFGGGNDARDPGVNLTGTVNSLVGIVSDLLDAGAERLSFLTYRTWESLPKSPSSDKAREPHQRLDPSSSTRNSLRLSMDSAPTNGSCDLTSLAPWK